MKNSTRFVRSWNLPTKRVGSVAKICQIFFSKLSSVIDSTNQVLITGAGTCIMERHQSIMERHQSNFYRLTCTPSCHQTALSSTPLILHHAWHHTYLQASPMIPWFQTHQKSLFQHLYYYCQVHNFLQNLSLLLT